MDKYKSIQGLDLLTNEELVEVQGVGTTALALHGAGFVNNRN